MGWGPQDEADSIAAILEALEAGINWIDTAHAYGFGLSEEVVGKAVKEWGQPVTVATKCGVLPNEDRTPNRFTSRVTILEEVGVEGQFDYPAPPIRSEIGHFSHPESLEDAADDVSQMARRAAEEPCHVHPMAGRFHRIQYRVENHIA